MTDQSTWHHALNLSYVLHEPSSSITVRDAVDTNRRNLQSIHALTTHIRGSSPAEIQARTFIDRDDVSSTGPIQNVYSLHIGTWPVLSAILQAIGGASTPIRITWLDGIDPNGQYESWEMFGATASVRASSALSFNEPSCWLAVPAFRPGAQSIHLYLRRLVWVDSATGVPVVIRQVEAALRAFSDQWDAPRALWGAPSELTLRELFRS